MRVVCDPRYCGVCKALEVLEVMMEAARKQAEALMKTSIEQTALNLPD
jgi:hypothetical protein